MMHQRITAEYLARLEPFSSLSAASRKQLASVCEAEIHERGAEPLSGDHRLSDSQIHLLQGELLLNLADGSTEVVVGGAESATRPINSRGQALAGIRAITDIVLLCVDNDLLDIFMTWDQLASPSPAAEGGESRDWRTMSGIYAAQNLASGAFASLPPAHIDLLLSRFERVRVERGSVVVRQSDPGDYYYVIESGRAEVVREVSGAQLQLAALGAGEAFGEEALLSGSTRNATVSMRSDGVLLRLSQSDFFELLREPLLRRVNLVEAQAKVAAGAQWLDVRYPAEFQAERMPDAINIPLNEIRNAAAALDPSKEYIAYCQSGRRSSAAAFLLSQRGFRAYLLEGGLRTPAGIG